MFKIFADHCVHADLIEALQSVGFKVLRAQEVGLAKSPDEEIFKYAKKRGLVLFSFDKDFGNPFHFDPTNTAGIVIVYIKNMSKKQIIKETFDFFKRATPKSLSGNGFIIEPGGRIRVIKRK